MKFFNLLALVSILILAACNPSFDESNSNQEAATFAVNQVQQNRTENIQMDTLGLPTEILIEFVTEIRDIGLEIPLPNENFAIITPDETLSVATDFSGRLIWSKTFKVDPSLPQQEISLPVQIQAKGSHKGFVKIDLKIRPWLDSDIQVLDTRFQDPKDGVRSRDFDNATLELSIGDVDIQYGGAHFDIDHQMDLSIQRNYLFFMEPELLQNSTSSQIAKTVNLAQGSFQIESYLFALGQEFPEPHRLKSYINNCSSQCLIAKNSVRTAVENKRLNFQLPVEVSHERIPQLRFRSLFVIAVKPSSPYIKPFVVYGLWTPAREEQEVNWLKAPITVLDSLDKLTALTKKESKPVDAINSVANVYEQFLAEPLPEEFKDKWSLSSEKLDQMLINRDEKIEKEFEVEKCETKRFEDSRQWAIDVWINGQKYVEKFECHLEKEVGAIEVNHISVVNEVIDYKNSPGHNTEIDILLQDVAFREVRIGESLSQGSNVFVKAYGEAKVETPWPIVRFSAITQAGTEGFFASAESVENNQRSRNTAIKQQILKAQYVKMDMTAKVVRCLSFYLKDEAKRYLHCNPDKVHEDQFQETWYYIYGNYKPSDQVFLNDPKDSSQGQMTFSFRGQKSFDDFAQFLADETVDFELVPRPRETRWSGFSDDLDKQLKSGESFKSFPAIVIH